MLKIKDVKYESDWEDGCPTCDWGSSYISNINILFEDDIQLSIETNQMYEYMLSEADYMKVLGNANSIDEIVLDLLKIIDNNGYQLKKRITYEDMQMKLNGKVIDMLQTLNKRKIIYLEV